MDEQLVDPSLGGSFRGQLAQIDAEDQHAWLKKRAAQLEAIIDNLPEAIIVTDPKGRLVHMNQAAEAILGRPALDIDPEAWPEKFGFYLDDAKTYYPGVSMPLVRALSDESVEAEEMILRQMDALNPVWISMSARPIHDESGEITGAIVLFRDVTYRKQIELSRENHAQRMEALYKFSRAIAESGNDLNALTHVVAVHAAENIGDACTVSLLSQSDNRIRIMAFHHPDPGARAQLRKLVMLSENSDTSEGIVAGVIRSGEPILVPSLNPEQLEAITLPEFKDYVREHGIQGFMVVPIIGRGGVLGAISLSRDHGRKPYTVEDQSFLTDISNRTSLAIENCRLLELAAGTDHRTPLR